MYMYFLYRHLSIRWCRLCCSSAGDFKLPLPRGLPSASRRCLNRRTWAATCPSPLQVHACLHAPHPRRLEPGHPAALVHQTARPGAQGLHRLWQVGNAAAAGGQGRRRSTAQRSAGAAARCISGLPRPAVRARCLLACSMRLYQQSLRWQGRLLVCLARHREKETPGAEGDSVTKMHEDLSGALPPSLSTLHHLVFTPNHPNPTCISHSCAWANSWTAAVPNAQRSPARLQWALCLGLWKAVARPCSATVCQRSACLQTPSTSCCTCSTARARSPARPGTVFKQQRARSRPTAAQVGASPKLAVPLPCQAQGPSMQELGAQPFLQRGAVLRRCLCHALQERCGTWCGARTGPSCASSFRTTWTVSLAASSAVLRTLQPCLCSSVLYSRPCLHGRLAPARATLQGSTSCALLQCKLWASMPSALSGRQLSSVQSWPCSIHAMRQPHRCLP